MTSLCGVKAQRLLNILHLVALRVDQQREREREREREIVELDNERKIS
jgi:hypothetical protein